MTDIRETNSHPAPHPRFTELKTTLATRLTLDLEKDWFKTSLRFTVNNAVEYYCSALPCHSQAA